MTVKASRALILLFVTAILSLLYLRIAYCGLAPDFTLTDIDGKTFSLSDFKGKVVILDFFATYCPPCREEMSHLKTVQREFGNKVVIISISVWKEDTDEKLKEFRSNYGITWILARDTANVRGKYDVPTIPTLCIIDQEGYIQHYHHGLTEASVLIGEINELLKISLTIIVSPNLSNVHFRIDGKDFYKSSTDLIVEIEAGKHQVELVDTLVKQNGDTEFRFSHWSGIGSGSTNPIQIEITASSTLKANYDVYYKLEFTQSGSETTTHVTVDGTTHKVPQTFWFKKGSSHSFTYEKQVNGGTGIRYTLTETSHASPITINSPLTINAHYRSQYYITVTSPHGSPTPSQWVDKGGTLTIKVTSPTGDNGAGTRYRCIGYKIDSGTLETGTSYTFTNVQTPHKIDFLWIPQYRVTFTESVPETGIPITILVNGNSHSGVTPFNYYEWFDNNSVITFGIDELLASSTIGKRYTLTHWTNILGLHIASPQLISGPEAFTAQYQTQYYLKVDTYPSSLTPQPDISPPGYWYTAGTLVTCKAHAVNGHYFHYWILDGNPQESGNTELIVVIDGPHNVTARYVAITDLNMDGNVDEADMLLIANAFHSKIGEENWNPRVDFDNNGVIDIRDLVKVALDIKST